MRSHDVGSAPFRGAPVEYLSLMNQIVHSTNSFFDWRVRVRAMTEEEIQIIQLQSFEGLAAGLGNVFARQALVVWSVASPEDLARNNYALPSPPELLENVPHYNFRFPVSVGLRAVEEIDTHIVCNRHALDCDFFADLSTVGHPRTERQFAKFEPCRTKSSIVHTHLPIDKNFDSH